MLKEIHLCVIYDQIKKYGGDTPSVAKGFALYLYLPTKTWTMLFSKATS